MTEEAVRAVLAHYLSHSAAGDEQAASTIYREDAVLEFPQSGERFEGVDHFLPWRREYPARIEYELDRVRGRDDVWVAELRIRRRRPRVRRRPGPPRVHLRRRGVAGTGLAGPLARRAATGGRAALSRAGVRGRPRARSRGAAPSPCGPGYPRIAVRVARRYGCQ
jgi:hypothetical protein